MDSSSPLEGAGALYVDDHDDVVLVEEEDFKGVKGAARDQEQVGYLYWTGAKAISTVAGCVKVSYRSFVKMSPLQQAHLFAIGVILTAPLAGSAIPAAIAIPLQIAGAGTSIRGLPFNPAVQELACRAAFESVSYMTDRGAQEAVEYNEIQRNLEKLQREIGARSQKLHQMKSQVSLANVFSFEEGEEPTETELATGKELKGELEPRIEIERREIKRLREECEMYKARLAQISKISKIASVGAS
jgi:hypothetical protein